MRVQHWLLGLAALALAGCCRISPAAPPAVGLQVRSLSFAGGNLPFTITTTTPPPPDSIVTVTVAGPDLNQTVPLTQLTLTTWQGALLAPPNNTGAAKLYSVTVTIVSPDGTVITDTQTFTVGGLDKPTLPNLR